MLACEVVARSCCWPCSDAASEGMGASKAHRRLFQTQATRRKRECRQGTRVHAHSCKHTSQPQHHALEARVGGAGAGQARAPGPIMLHKRTRPYHAAQAHPALSCCTSAPGPIMLHKRTRPYHAAQAHPALSCCTSAPGPFMLHKRTWPFHPAQAHPALSCCASGQIRKAPGGLTHQTQNRTSRQRTPPRALRQVAARPGRQRPPLGVPPAARPVAGARGGDG